METSEIEERLTMLEGAQAHLFQQNKSCYENFLKEMGAVKKVRVLWMLVVIDILIRISQWL